MIWVLVAAVVVLLIVIGVLVQRHERSRRLQAGFGPEYQRVIEDRGDRRAAERELSDRQERHETFELRELSPEARADYARRWKETQRDFVDEPQRAVGEADSLVRSVMHDRGYPVDDDFERRAADLSVDHPVVVENYGRLMPSPCGRAAAMRAPSSCANRWSTTELCSPTCSAHSMTGDQPTRMRTESHT